MIIVFVFFQCSCQLIVHGFLFNHPKNHGISKLVGTGDSQEPLPKTESNPSFSEGAIADS